MLSEVTPSPSKLLQNGIAKSIPATDQLERPDEFAMAEAESFLDLVKSEVVLTMDIDGKDGGVDSSSLVNAEKPNNHRRRPSNANRFSHKRRESQIWEGDFDQARSDRKRKRAGTDADTEDESMDFIPNTVDGREPVQLSVGTCVSRRGSKRASTIKLNLDMDENIAKAVERWNNLCSVEKFVASLLYIFGYQQLHALILSELVYKAIQPSESSSAAIREIPSISFQSSMPSQW